MSGQSDRHKRAGCLIIFTANSGTTVAESWRRKSSLSRLLYLGSRRSLHSRINQSGVQVWIMAYMLSAVQLRDWFHGEVEYSFEITAED